MIPTCFVRNKSIMISRESAGHMGLRKGDFVRVERVSDNHVRIHPAEGKGIGFDGRQITLPRDVGLPNGTVLAITHAAEKALDLTVAEDPLAEIYVGHDGWGTALPPSWLMQTVVGTTDVKGFASTGENLAELIVSLFEKHLPPGAPWRFMDFGCGCGRLCRAMPLFQQVQVTGCDLQVAAVEWCRRYLPGQFFVGQETPPLALGDAAFDCLAAISVLTHLSEQHQDAWLAEWARIVRPGGVLFVTFRGRDAVANFLPQELNKFEAAWNVGDGFTFSKTDFWGGVFPEYYGGAWQTEEYVRTHWAKYFEVVEIIPSGGAMRQDAALLKRRR